MSITVWMWLAVLCPLLGIALCFSAETLRRAVQICIAGNVGALILGGITLGLFLHSGGKTSESAITFWTFIPTAQGNPADHAFGQLNDFHAQIGIVVDGISLFLMLAILSVVTTVQIYSTVFMRHDPDLRRYFWLSSLLGFAAMGTVVSANLLTFVLVWGLGGVVMQLLISHWYERESSAASFWRMGIILQISDLLLLGAIVFEYVKFAPFVGIKPPSGGRDVSDPTSFSLLAPVWHQAHAGVVSGVGLRTLTVLAILIIVSAVVRAGQVGATMWFANLANAPFPIVGLLVSTAPIAGAIALTVRLYPLLVEAPHALTVLAVIGLISMIVGAWLALLERNLVRLLVYLTVGQVGLLFVVAAAGYPQAAIYGFMLLAAGVSLLFMGISNVAVAYETMEIDEVGGVWQRLPVTRWLLLVGSLSVAGIGVGGFWPLRAEIGGVINSSNTTMHHTLQLFLPIGIGLSAAAVGRFFWFLVAGEPAVRRGFRATKIREANSGMLIGPLLLAIALVAVGFCGLPFTGSNGWSIFRYLNVYGVNTNVLTSNVTWTLAIVLPIVGLVLGITACRRSIVSRSVLDSLRDWTSLDKPGELLVRYGFMTIGQGLLRIDEELIVPTLSATGEGIDLVAAVIDKHQPKKLSIVLLMTFGASILLVFGFGLAVTGHFPLVVNK